MAPWHRTAAFLSSALAFLLYFGATYAAEPESAITYFDNPPAWLFFFEDTTSVIYHDLTFGNLYVSQDEGKNWARADDIPSGQAIMFVDHPFDNRVAFVLTNTNTHYRTDDRGKTWHSFDVPDPVAHVQKPLSFHSDPNKSEYILFQTAKCTRIGLVDICQDNTYYTKDGFATSPEMLLKDVSRCQFAHSSKDFKHDAHQDLIYCVAHESSSVTGSHTFASRRLYSSTDFFASKQNEDLGIGKNAKGVLAFAIVSKFAVVALKDLSPGSDGDMLLYVTVDTKEWAKAQFPHASQARLRENAYTIVESTVHSLAVDVVLHEMSSVGTLFVSNSNGTYFVESLKDTNRNTAGYVDFENIYGIEGVGIANVVANAQDVERQMTAKQIQSVITFDDGSSWRSLSAPSGSCSSDTCSLHLYSVTDAYNYGRIFSSPAPGFVMGVGSVGNALAPYDESNTYMSIDAGLTWTRVHEGPYLYEFGDSGSVVVVVDDEQVTDTILYSTDMGRTWNTHNVGIQFRARGLTTVSDSTSQKFVLTGQVTRQAQQDGRRNVVIYLDFATLDRPKCGESDKEPWYARAKVDSECIMGVQQWYSRRKPDANCYMGEKFHDPEVREDKCQCEEHDYECDYNFVRSDGKCVPSGPERIPSTQCTLGRADEKYMGSSGYRKIPGNKCEGGVRLDEPVSKDCSEAQPAEGEIVQQIHAFSADIVQSEYFKGSKTVLVRLSDDSIWQSSNEGYTWEQQHPEERFLAFYMHAHSNDRAYLITDTNKFYYTTDTGRFWHTLNAPSPPNTFGAQVLRFQTDSDHLIWIGSVDCEVGSDRCRAEAQYSGNNGRTWHFVDDYVVNCDWARDDKLRIDSSQILCESYENKQGSQLLFGTQNNALQLVSGTDYYAKKTKLFDHVVGFTKFSQYLIVAEYLPMRGALNLQVSLDGLTFAPGNFPPSMHPDSHAYTVLESSTGSIFLHMTMNEWPTPWGNILKSNSNGTYFGVSIENVNRNMGGFVDFEKFQGLDGIALVNVVANPAEAALTGRKTLQTRITHNDGGTWKPLIPPSVDSVGQKYSCSSVGCRLHVHGYTERFDARATYSSPAVVGVVMAVGNVGEVLAPYTESDTFLSRDGGFTWEEVHKDAHLWAFGDSGSVIVIVNDEDPTDHVLFTIDEGLNWREFKFSTEKIRVRDIMTVPEDTSRKFMLLGQYTGTGGSVVVHLDFSSLTHKQCIVDLDDPGHDDFELWSPSQERDQLCLFGRQTLYHRRKREVNCVVGDTPKALDNIVRNCMCTAEDFECEFNYVRNGAGECVLVPGIAPRPADDSCRNDEDYWYERTAYRKVFYSSCEGGDRIDRGASHLCPGIKGHSAMFWMMAVLFPFAMTGLIVWWWYKKSGMARGMIRLPGGRGDYSHLGSSESGVLATLASVPWFLLGLGGIAFEWVASSFDAVSMSYRARRGYRNVPVDEDARILRFEDEE